MIEGGAGHLRKREIRPIKIRIKLIKNRRFIVPRERGKSVLDTARRWDRKTQLGRDWFAG